MKKEIPPPKLVKRASDEYLQNIKPQAEDLDPEKDYIEADMQKTEEDSDRTMRIERKSRDKKIQDESHLRKKEQRQKEEERGEKSEQFLYDTAKKLLDILSKYYPEFYLLDRNDPYRESHCYRTGKHYLREGKMDLEDREGVDVAIQLSCKLDGRKIYGLIKYNATSSIINANFANRKLKKMGHNKTNEGLKIQKAILSNPHSKMERELVRDILEDIRQLGLIPEVFDEEKILLEFH